MKVVFIANYATHHQLPFLQSMYEQLGDDFMFLGTNEMSEERKKMGWEIDESKYPYIHKYEDALHEDIVRECDILICGSCHYIYYRRRMDMGRITFRYYERLYKKGRIRAFLPGSYKNNYICHTKYKDKPVYLLCAGAYVAGDFRLLGAYKNKAYKWGYFPAVINRDIDELIAGKIKNEILWTGRMIDWKHAESAVELARRLKRHGIDYHLTMIGEGECRKDIEALVAKYYLEDRVTLKPFMEPSKIREHMDKCSIYLMTSNQEEGWGAVVNEAMNSAAVLVGTRQAGAVPYLIKDKVNGYIYNYGDTRALCSIVEEILSDPVKAGNVGRAAYETITGMWNSDVASRRFIEFAKGLLSGEHTSYADGPMSEAD